MMRSLSRDRSTISYRSELNQATNQVVVCGVSRIVIVFSMFLLLFQRVSITEFIFSVRSIVAIEVFFPSRMHTHQNPDKTWDNLEVTAQGQVRNTAVTAASVLLVHRTKFRGSRGFFGHDCSGNRGDLLFTVVSISQ